MISKMIDRLSLSLKLENNSIQVKPEKFKIGSLLEEAGEQLLQKYKKRVIKIEYDDSSLYADRTLIHLVMLNLMDNALKYSDGDVIAKATEAENGIKVEVIDRGMGIHEKELENITKKFYRVNKNGWDNSLGLGLALVKYILRLHSSDLQITSKPAVGSTFYFIIKDYIKPEQSSS
jgi:signal transduction histidine kinase